MCVTSNADFNHLHVHYGYSAKDGCQKVGSSVLHARKMGFRALAMTDHGTNGGWIKFVAECTRKKDKSGKTIPYPMLKPILGCEVYLARRHERHDKENQPEGKKGNRHLLLVAKNWDGYQNLCTLIQKSYSDGFYHSPRVDIDLLAQYSKGIMASSACLSSVVNACLLNGKYDEARKAAILFKDIYGEDFFLEVMFHGIDEEAAIIVDILKLGSELGIPVVATNDCFVAGTMIETSVGVKPIETVEVGDYVVTHENRLKPVQFVNRRIAPSSVKIKANVGTVCFETTPEHPVYVAQRLRNGFTKPQWKPAGELTPADYLAVHASPVQVFSKCGIATLDVRSVIGPEFDHLLEDEFYVTRQGFGGGDGVLRIPRQLPVTDSLLFVLGRYVAEGSADRYGGSVCFPAHVRELDIQNKVAQYFEQFGSTVYRPHRGNDGKLVFSSVIWNALLPALCGDGAENKCLPKVPGETYSAWSSSQILQIVSGYVGGDGHIPEKCQRSGLLAASTSRRLCFEIAHVFQQHGLFVFPTVRTRFSNHTNSNANPARWKPLWTLSVSPSDFPCMERLLGVKVPTCVSRSVFRRKAILSGQFRFIKVKSVAASKSPVDVFNLQVGDDESYVANGFVVHNCHYTTKDMAESQEALIAMKFNKCITDPSRMRFPYDEFHMKSAAEMAQIFGHRPELLLNTVAFAERVDDKSIERNMGGMRLPRFIIPPGFKNQHSYLENLAYKGLADLGWDASQAHVDRLKLELADVKVALTTNGYDFPSYILSKWKVIHDANEDGILTGCGRGSGYGSVLLRTLGITYGPDPLEHGLLWERFLGFDNMRLYHPSHFGLKKVSAVPTGDVDLAAMVDAVEEQREEEESTRAIEAELDQARDVSADPGGVDRY